MKMATGEVIGAEELGGARVHATITGLADQIAVDECVYPSCDPNRVLTKGIDLTLLSRLGNGLPRSTNDPRYCLR